MIFDFARARRAAALPIAVTVGHIVSLVLVVTLHDMWRLLGLLGILPAIGVVAWSGYVDRRTMARMIAGYRSGPTE